jgi:hypothetical protein
VKGLKNTWVSLNSLQLDQLVLMYQRGWLTGQPLPDLCTKIQADASLLQWKTLDPQSMSMIFCGRWNLEEDSSNKIESMMCPG